jgi:hypothetical protein
MGTTYAGNAFQATDLQRNHRVVLDAARESGAVVRDKDGLLLLIQPAEVAQRGEYIAEVLWSAACLERALQIPPTMRRPAMYGSFAWISVMPEDDQKQFLTEVIDQVLISRNSGSKEKLEVFIEDWKVTALTWSDEDLREELTQDLDRPLHDVVL